MLCRQANYCLYCVAQWGGVKSNGIKANFWLDPFAWMLVTPGHAVAQLVEALRYKPEGRGFDS
jgi:hypothetical protein